MVYSVVRAASTKCVLRATVLRTAHSLLAVGRKVWAPPGDVAIGEQEEAREANTEVASAMVESVQAYIKLHSKDAAVSPAKRLLLSLHNRLPPPLPPCMARR